MPTELNTVNLFVKDVARATSFYTEVLGLTLDSERSEPPAFALLRAGPCTLTLQDASVPGAQLGAADSVELGFAVDDVQAVAERLAAWGMAVGQIQQMGWGTALEARDEDGHRMNVLKMRER